MYNAIIANCIINRNAKCISIILTPRSNVNIINIFVVSHKPGAKDKKHNSHITMFVAVPVPFFITALFITYITLGIPNATNMYTKRIIK